MKSKGLFVGLCGLDVVYYENQPLPQEDVKLTVHDVRTYVGGPAANAAITFQLLGGQSTIVSFVGNSPVGDLVKRMVGLQSVRLEDMCDDRSEKCISAIYVNKSAATRTIFSGRNSVSKLRDAGLLRTLIQQHHFVLYDGHFPQMEETLLTTCRELHKPLIIDVGGWQDSFSNILTYDPILICSEVFNQDGADGIDLMAKYGHTHTAITRGSKSVQFCTAGMAGREEIPVPTVRAIDTLGAGDVFHGAFCYFSQTLKEDFATALRHAVDVASTSTTVYGVVEGVNKYVRMHLPPIN